MIHLKHRTTGTRLEVFGRKFAIRRKKSEERIYIYINNIPRAPMTSIFEGQPPKNKAEIPIKTKGIWVLGVLYCL